MGVKNRILTRIVRVRQEKMIIIESNVYRCNQRSAMKAFSFIVVVIIPSAWFAFA